MSRTGIRWVLLAVLVGGGVVLCLPAGSMGGVVGSPHDFSTTSLLTGYQTTPLTSAGICSICHIPHNALDNVLWARSLDPYRNALGMDGGSGASSDLPDYRKKVTLQCYDCHDAHVTTVKVNDLPAFVDFTTDHKPQNIAFGYTTPATGKDSGSTMKEDGPGGVESGYYENSPPFTDNTQSYYGADSSPSSPFDPRSGLATDNVTLAKTGGHFFKSRNPNTSKGIYIGDKLPCTDCHDPHAWDSTNLDWQAFFRPKELFGTARWTTVFGSSRPRASTFMANDITDLSGVSTGRSDPDSRKLCALCHGYSDALGPPVTFNEINSDYSSTESIITPPDSIVEHHQSSSVACISCHGHNSIGANCSQCHGFPPSDTASPRYPVNAPSTFVPSPDPGANDSHPRHVGNKAGQGANTFSSYSFTCGVCHYGSALGIDSGLNHHQNSLVSVVLDGAFTSVGSGDDNTNYYNPDAVPLYSRTGQLDNGTSNTGWGNSSGRYGGNRCRNVYCHSAGRNPASMTANNDNDYRRPEWNSGRLGCNGCHGDPAVDNTNVAYGMPSYPGGLPGSDNANTHGAHVVTAGYECSVCHAGTATGVGASRAIVGTSPTLHVNRVRNVQFDGSTASGTYDNNPVTKTCHVVSCHGSDTPRWGGNLANGCFSCHTGTETIEKPQIDYGTAGVPNPVDNNEYLYSGHGRSATNYPGSNNLPAGFANYAVSPVDCYYCHSQAALHTTKSSNDPFRLGSALDNTTGGIGTWTGAWADNTDLLCIGCHGSDTDRLTHDNAAKGTTTIDAQTHAHGITGTKYTWPVSPWKCVDCHDPHGDGKSGSERIMMIRSGINAPNDNTDANAGSDGKSKPKRTTGLRAVAFSDLSGFGAGSYAQSGNDDTNGPWGPCEVCHTQTTAYNRKLGLDNAASHATRTTRCTTCHPHKAGFAPTACKGCHGPDGVAATAPNISKYWADNTGQGGHGRSGINLECETCHDTSYLSSDEHKTDGSAGSGPPPANINTLLDPDVTAPGPNRAPNRNTPHLKSDYFPVAPTAKYQFALAFNTKCGNPASGCHPNPPHNNHPTIPSGSSDPLDNVMRFGEHNTVSDPKLYYWYPAYASYPDKFWETRSPWTIGDLTTDAITGGYSDNSVRYGVCVTCHDPHGTDAPKNLTGSTNRMLRGNSKSSGQFCNTACHTSRPPP